MTGLRLAPGAAPVTVLEMHRSGTSCLAGCLEDAGLFPGEVSRAAPFNKKGNNENLAVMEFTDEVLAEAGGSRAPPLPDVESAGCQPEASEPGGSSAVTPRKSAGRWRTRGCC